MDSKEKGKSKSSALRTRRERQARARCSNSSADEDQGDSQLHAPGSNTAPVSKQPGSSYSSDETLKAYEHEVTSALHNVRIPQDDDNYATATDCTLTDVSPAEDTDCYGYHENRGSFLSNASEGDVESEGEGISSEQLLQVVDNYLKNKPWDTHSTSSVHSTSSRSSLTLTETEQEGSDHLETGPSLNGSERRLLPKGTGSAICRISQIEDDFEPNFLVQTTSGNFYVPSSTSAPTVNQGVFSNNTGTLPSTSKTVCSPITTAGTIISNTLPTNSSRSSGATSSLPRFDPPPPPLPERNPSLYNTSVITEVVSTPPIIPPPAPVLGDPIQSRAATPPSTMVLPQSEARPYQSIQSLQGTHTSMQREDRYHHCEYPSNVPSPATTAATTPLPPFTRALHNDFRQPPPKIQPTKRQKKKVKPQKVCGVRHWKCLAVVFILVTLVLAAVVAYFIATTALDVNWNVEDQPGHMEGDEGIEDSTADSLNTYKPIDTVFQTNISPTRASAIGLGQSFKTEIPPGSFSRTLLFIPTAKFVEFNVSVPKDSHLAVYARKGLLPSHTQFDFMQVLDGSKYSPGEEVEIDRETRSEGHYFIPVVEELPFHVEGTEEEIHRRDVRDSKMMENSLYNHFEQTRKRNKRATTVVVYQTFVQYMLLGHWHIAIYNDGTLPEKVSMTTSPHQGPTEPDTNCYSGCSGNGRCVEGKCECYPAYTGDDCSIGVCPVICSGNGFYEGGTCLCDLGWKGVECNIPNHQCIVQDCNNHGDCFGGKCVCNQGYRGEVCEIVDCKDPSCSGHGVCVEGTCHCGHGWMSEDCSQPVPEATATACPTAVIPTLAKEEEEEEEGDEEEGPAEGESEKPSSEIPITERCNDNGYYDNSAATCVCFDRWGGDDCSQEVCFEDNDCGLHQECKMSKCVCKEGWTGDDCMQAHCDLPCSENGYCVRGVCECQPGWNGKQCTIEGCPSSCSGHGECRWISNSWKCFCERHWRGDGCNIGIENRCNDARDNDNDGLIDCKDPDCCMSIQCISNNLCRSVPLPTHLLAQADPVSPNAPFYEHVSFLAKPNGVQLSAMPFVFTESPHRIAVVRGKVTTADGSPIVGVTVRIQDMALFGHTLTRNDGMYDLMVRGGGAISLQFSRQPFQTTTISAFVPWSEFVVMDDVTMRMEAVERESCDWSLYERPEVVFLSEQMVNKGACSDSILVDKRTVHERVPIPGTTISLSYHSNSAPGYQSLIHLQLTPAHYVENLKLVHLKITVQGQIFEKRMEALKDLTYTYAWNKMNAYGEKAYGPVRATVSVGYEYTTCGTIMWAKKTTKIDGYDMDTTGMAGWKISGHHGYNVKQAIVHKGDGTDIRVADENPAMITAVLGNGKRRNIDCPQCDGKAKGNKLLAPVAVASAPDGSLFVGDYNFIRKIQPDGNVTSVLHLQVSYFPSRKYYLAVSPVDGSVYMSDTQTRQILKLRYILAPSDITDNVELVAGTGGQCLPLDSKKCGDGGPAREAKLIGPKGITISQDGTIYVVDGSVVRKISPDGIISTYLGSHDIIDAQRPLKCNGRMTFDEVRLEWPVDIAVNPVDNSVAILDHNVVLKLTPDKQVTVEAGVPVNCMVAMNHTLVKNKEQSDLDPLATEAILTNPRAIAFSLSGELYITESNNEKIHRVRKVGADGRLVRVAGGEAECDCNLDDCECFNGDDIAATDAMLFIPTDITVSPDNVVYIADQGNLRIHGIMSSMPIVYHNKQYHIESDSTLELYVFNYEGKHMMTKDAVTDEAIFEFSYTDNNNMKTMMDSSGHILRLNRDLNGRLTTITTPNNDRYDLDVNSYGFLKGVHSSNGQAIATFNYYSDSGLLATAAQGDVLKTLYRYDHYGRVYAATEVNAEQEIIDDKTMNVSVALNNTVIIKFVNGLELHVESNSYPTMELSSRVPLKRKITLPSGNVHRLEWRFYVRRGGRKNKRTIQVVGRKLRINGINVLTLEYNRFTKTETLHDAANIPQLIISHNNKGLPTEWMPNNGMKSVLVDYDSEGRVSRWRKGFIFEMIEYDDEGRVIGKQYSDGSSWRFVYHDGRQPTTIIFPSGQEYLLGYKSGNLAVITTPTKTTYSMERLASIGYYRNMYFINGTQWLLQDYLSNGSPSTTFYPGNLRRVTRMYDNQARLTDVFYDETAIKYDYYSIEGQLRSIEMKESHLRSALRYKYHGPLAKESSMRFNQESYLGVEYRYLYDNNFKMVSTQADFDGSVLPPCNFTYHPEKGHPVQYCNYTVIQMDWFAVVLSKGDAKVTKQFDAYGRLIIYQLDVRDISVFTMTLKYNNISFVSERKIKILGNEDTFKFDYDTTGQIIEAMAVNWLSWRYSYDNNGNLLNIVYNDDEYHLRHDAGDRVTQFKNKMYKVDSDGFLTQRGEEMVDYNSNGQLKHAIKEGEYEVWYNYDGLGRRVIQADGENNRIQYFYGDIENPWCVSHIYDKASGDIWTLMYDLEGFLMSIMIGDRQYYVTTDQVGSPVAVFNSRGELVKQIVYSPYGSIVQDTASDFRLHIGFRGGIHDYTTQLVHFKNGDYDPSTGKWTTPQMDMWDWATQTNRHPVLNLYVFSGNNPVNLNINNLGFMKGVIDWLPMVGFSAETMIPNVDRQGEIVRDQSYSYTAEIQKSKVTSSEECLAANLMDSFSHHFLTLPTRQILTGALTDDQPTLSTVDIGSTIFGHSGVLYVQNGQVITQLVDINNDHIVKIAKILNGSEVLERMHHTEHGKDIRYFVKGRNSMNRDLSIIGSSGGGQLVERIDLNEELSVTIHTIYPGHMNQIANIDIKIHSKYGVLNIRYGATVAEETARIMRHTKHKAILRAWNQERDLLLQGKAGTRQWTEEERTSIIENHYVDGYNGFFVMDIDKYPELADDSNCIKLLTNEEGEQLAVEQLISQ